MKACPTYRVWFRDDAACAAAIRSGGAFDVEASSYGANDVALEFLVTSGLWGLLVSMEPDGLRRDNGKPWWALDAVEVLRELAGVDRIAHCGKVLRDVRLMMLAGFDALDLYDEHGRIVHALREGLACGEPLERVLGRLETEPPRDA